MEASLNYRYPGAKSFTTQEEHLFMGREQDTERLYQLIDTQQLVILYGKSGCGKSSLINAGIIPLLEKEPINKARYFNIRLFNKTQGIDQEQVSTPLDKVLDVLALSKPEELPWMNVFKENATPSGLLWYWVKQVQNQNADTPIILFFDQFEELFTYSEEEVSAFAAELGMVLYQKIPNFFRKKEYFAELDATQSDFVYANPDLRVVFSIRADRMSLLNRLTKYLPNLLKYHYELDAISEEAAREAIMIPADLDGSFYTPKFSYEPETVTAIIEGAKNSYTGKIETATLQIICRFVEEVKTRNLQGKPISPTILGNITDIFSDYYQNSLKELSTQERSLAAEVIEEKFIQNNQRIPFAANHLKQEYHLTDTILDQLEKSTLLRKEQDGVGRAIYEIGHDTLVEPILAFAVLRKEKAKRSRLQKIVGLSVLALVLVLGLLAFFIQLWQGAEIAKKDAVYAKAKAEKATQQANSNLYKLYKEQAQILKDNGDNVKRNDDSENATYYYDSARVILKQIPSSDTTGKTLKNELAKPAYQ